MRDDVSDDVSDDGRRGRDELKMVKRERRTKDGVSRR